MSQHTTQRRKSITDLQAMKGSQKIVSLTAYTAPMASMLDAQVDMLLVGDSLGMVLYGMDSTLPVTLEMMIRHTQAVVKHSSQAIIMADMPFGSYQESPEQAFANAAKLLCETGCQAVKLEGGDEMLETVRFLTQRGIPTMAHIGLKPQHVHAMGGYKYQGRDDAAAAALLAQAKAFEEAGAFGLLLEGVKESIAQEITQGVNIPTIGIGASVSCDGQVLVSEDMLGIHERTAKFVKEYTNLRETITQAVTKYADDVRQQNFPESQHCFGVTKQCD